jgi:hypothetical protein
MTASPHEMIDNNVTAPVLARWLGISGKEVYDLAKAGVIVRVGRDLYALEPSVRQYCEHLRRRASRQGTSGQPG